MPGLVLRKLADRRGARTKVMNPSTGKIGLLNPETGKFEGWPAEGLMIEEIPAKCGMSTKMVDRLIGMGYLKRIGEKPITIPAGPPNNPYAKTHNFVQCDKLVFTTLEGEVTYKVVKNPGKYEPRGEGAIVVHEYLMELVSAPTLAEKRLITPVFVKRVTTKLKPNRKGK